MRRTWIISCGFMLAFALPGWVSAQNFPTKAIKLVVPYPPGGGVDITARAIQAKLQDAYRLGFIVENRVGAGGAIGTESVSKAPADGYTLLMGSAAPLTVLPAVRRNVGYNAEKDFVPISLVASVPHVIVISSGLPPTSLGEFVTYAKSQARSISFGSPGPGSVHHLAGELFRAATGVQLLHVPYKGTGQMIPDLISGQIQMTSIEISAALPYIRAGTFRALGIAAKTRSPLVPELQTMSELGFPNFEITSWFGVLAPTGTPAKVVADLAEKIQLLRSNQEFNETISKLGSTTVLSSPEEFQKHMHSEIAKWGDLVRKSNLKVE